MIAHDRGFDPTRTETIIAALKILSRDIQSGDGVANAALREAAEHMQCLSNLLTRPPVDLRKTAEGQPCVMCGAEDGTTVLHHIRTGHLGMGKKPKDHRGIELCSKCHVYVHGDGIHDYKAVLIAYLRQVDRWLEAGAFK